MDPGNGLPADHNSSEICRWETPRRLGNIYLWLFAADRGDVGGDVMTNGEYQTDRLTNITCDEISGHIAASVPGQTSVGDHQREVES